MELMGSVTRTSPEQTTGDSVVEKFHFIPREESRTQSAITRFKFFEIS